jgi:putative ABC transport system permease protein
MLQDIRFGFRMLVRNPGVTALATAALALGIGGSTAIFSVVNAVLLKPLPVSDPQRLVWIWANSPARNLPFAFAAYSTYAEWKSGSAAFESMSAYSPGSATLLVGNNSERVDVMRVNASFFPMLGVRPFTGRNFTEAEDQPGAPKVALLACSVWERWFASDPAIVGQSINLDGESVAVDGVLPRGFEFPNRAADIYLPIASSTARGAQPSPSVGVYGRLKQGVSIERAQAEIDAVSRRLAAAYPQMQGRGAHVWRVHDFTVRDVRLSLLVLFGAVGMVLLIACANVANLLLVRSSVRQREIALRTALGAGRARILRQLLTESVVLALFGGTAGLALAAGAVQSVPHFASDRIPFLNQVSLDANVLAFAILACLFTGILFGLVPALSAFRGRIYATLKEGSIAAGESRARNRFRSALVVIEVALALLLGVGATLMMRSLMRLQTTSPGFDAGGVLTASVTLPLPKYPKPEQRIAFFQHVLERLDAMPGVKVASMVNLIPFAGSNTGQNLRIEGRPAPRPEETPIFWQRIIDPSYLRVMHIPLLRGREFTEQDNAGAMRVAIINATMARRFWPGADPLGRRFGFPDRWMTIVGIAGDVKFTSLTQEAEPEFYQPYRQAPAPDMVVTLRTSSDPLLSAPALREATRETDPTQPISRVTAMEQYLSDAAGTPRLSAILLTAFGSTALLLAAIGIYGVISFSVARRTREIGVRIALGASRRDVMRIVVGHAVLLAAVGVVVGIAAALALMRVMGRLLFGVSATEPAAYAAVSALLLAVAALAAYIPARRAALISPSVALRYE